MGQEESHLVDESTPPETLESRTIESVGKYIRDGKAKRIVTMVGAGISTSAGIPDFRSPDTGLYANLARLNLPYAEAVFDISYFRQNPLPFYTLAHELYPGRYRPTITHSFIALLEKKGLLLMNFSQNIDCLEREAGVSGEKMVEAHGSFATQRCIECHRPYPDREMKEIIQKKEVPRCQNEACLGLVKPDIVFFGEQLPEAFFLNRMLPGAADLAIVMGTSLQVKPFATLPHFVRSGAPRVLINLERVGAMGSRPDDVLVLGDCDAGVRKLAKACGWLEELEEMWAKTSTAVPTDRLHAEVGEQKQKTKDEELEDEIEKLTKEVDETLKLGREHAQMVAGEQVRPAEKIDEAKVKEDVEGGDVPSVSKPEAPVTEVDGQMKSPEPAESGEHDSDSNKVEFEGGGLSHVFVSEKGGKPAL